MEQPKNLDQVIASRLSQFEKEDPLYYIPKSLNDWYTTWNFSEYDANIYNHGLHQYPARFIPQLTRKIIRTFADKNSKVLDIFSGSGTTLLECKYLGIKKSYGIELNPFAVFIANTKLQDVNETDVFDELHFIEENYNNPALPYEKVTFKNIDFWYPDYVIEDLSKLLSVMYKIKNEKIRRFYLLVFCEISRKVSYLDHGGFKMYRSRTKVHSDFKPNVWAEFTKTANRNIDLLIQNNNITKENKTKQILVLGDSRKIHDEIPANQIDLILTSPPYGDSRTTVAYGQYSRLPWQWLSKSDVIINLDRELLGGDTKNLDCSILNLSAKLKEQCEAVEKADDSNRVKDVIAFYNDLYETLSSAIHYLKSGGYFVLVTGNRTVKKVYLRTDIIITEFAEHLGCSTEKICSRKILNKRMASKNSPTNEKGKTADTMMTENIIILRKN